MQVLLPRLRDDNERRIANIDFAGDWIRRESGELENIRQSLDLTATGANFTQANSIPSMWARPLLFEMALYDSTHPMHERILGEWRGLLAMLALKEWYGFNLTFEPLEIPNPTDENSPEFLRVLHKLLPTHTLDANTTWERLNLILLDNDPIGITSPTTLVCTSVSYSFQRMPWFDRDKECLGDPTDLRDEENEPVLKSGENEAVASWLDGLRQSQGIGGLPIFDGNPSAEYRERIRLITNTLHGLFDSFIADLVGDVPITPFPLSNNAYGGPLAGIYRGLDNPVRVLNRQPSVKLVPSREEAPDTVILIDDQTIAEQWQRREQDVVVWGTRTLANYKTFSGELQEPLPADVRLQDPQNFFTEKLFVVGQEKAFHENGTLIPEGSNALMFNGVSVTPILPITQDLLSYLNVHDLQKRIEFERQSDAITVKLRLPLSGIDGQNQDFQISKQYSTDDIKSITFTPVLEIWPNFKTPTWQTYYTYFTRAEQNTFDVKPFVPVGTAETRLLERGMHKWEITKTSRFPEAMVCEYEGAEAGVLLISVPDVLSVSERTWTVGIDFGTSSTTVYRNNEQNRPERIEFATHLLQVTNSSQRGALLYDDFLPPENQETPFFSLFQQFNDDESEESLLGGHIYFLDDYQKFSGKENIVSNLKWSFEPRDLKRTRIFLKQLCLQCAAEAVRAEIGQINWRFSYPLSFTDLNRQQFENNWNTVVSDCQEATGLQQQVVTPAQSESVAIAKYFATTLQDETDPGVFRNAVCIDIGGETSDIAIWQDYELCWQTSLRFAGRHLFSNLLRENLNFLQTLGADEEGIELLRDELPNRGYQAEATPTAVMNPQESSESDIDSNFHARADALIQEQAGRWLQIFGRDLIADSEARGFIQLIATGIAGLLYYVGLVLRHLAAQKNLNFDPQMPSIYIGGNGSNILHWVGLIEGNTDFRNANDCTRRLKQVVLDTSGSEENDHRALSISRLPKEEAAFGLVVEGPVDDLETVDIDILAGEAFTEDGNNCQLTELLTADRFTNRLRIDSELRQIGNFIKIFNDRLGERTGRLTDLNDNEKKRICDIVNDDLTKRRQKSSEDIVVEPLFILALKELLTERAQQWRKTGRN